MCPLWPDPSPELQRSAASRWRKVWAAPAKFTTEFVTKFVPLTVSVKAPSPTFLLVGKMLVVVGAGLLTVNVCALEVPPPGVGFVTVMLNVPAVVRSLAGIDAVN